MKWCFYPHLNVFFLHFLQSVIQCAHRVRKREIQIWQNMNGNDRVLWWAALNLCNTEILIWSPTLPLDPGSPISSIYLKVNFIPTENWNLQKLENSKKVPWNKIYFARGLVEIWFTLFIGLLHVCLLQRSSCNCIASQRRRPCNKTIYMGFLSGFWIWNCFTGLIAHCTENVWGNEACPEYVWDMYGASTEVCLGHHLLTSNPAVN